MKNYNNSIRHLLILLTGVLMLAASFSSVYANQPHKLVIQVSSDDPQTQTIALNNAVNVQKHYGMDNVMVEIVAYGPGLTLLTAQSKQKSRVESLAMQDITFSACGNTMSKMEKKSGKKVVLAEGVTVVPAGVVRIMELQEQGYAYLRP